MYVCMYVSMYVCMYVSMYDNGCLFPVQKTKIEGVPLKGVVRIDIKLIKSIISKTT